MMQETIEFRIPEKKAQEFLAHADGNCIGGSVRKIELEQNDPLFQRIGEIDREFRSKGSAFFTAWIPHRRYTRRELESAQAFDLIIKRVFEPSGEECGTKYDASTVCSLCGAGDAQASNLFLDAKSLARRGNLAIAKSIGGEVVASAAFVELFKAHALQGARFQPICTQTRPSEHIPGWYQLIGTDKRAEIVEPTRAGMNPFDEDREGRYRCPWCDVLGLNLLSELSVARTSFQGTDIAFTKQRVGVRRGLLRPEPSLLISPRLWRVLEQSRLKGCRVEVAHLI